MKKAIIAMLGLAAASWLWAGSGASFTYQAALRDEHGNLVKDGDVVVRSHNVTIRLWNQESGGVLLWARNFNIYTDEMGLFNLEVSDAGSAISGEDQRCATLAEVFMRQRPGEVYIGLEVKGSSGEVVPRQCLFAVPFAAVADDVRAISTNITVGGAITLGGGNVRVANDGITQTTGSSEFQNLKVNGTLQAGGTVTAGNGLVVNGGTVTIRTDVALDQGRKLTVGGSEVVPVPLYGIILWTQSELPDNEHWAVCNGQTVNGVKTPNLTGLFIVGAGGGGYALGSTGGEAAHKLSAGEMPAHSHYYAGDDQIESRDSRCTRMAGWMSKGYDAKSELSGNAKIYYTSETGGNQAHENRPPFYAAYYIMRVK